MPKWRKLHVKVRESLDVNEMPDDFTRLLWVLLPIALDREGRGQDSPAWVRSNVFPLRLDVTLEQIQQAMDWIAEHEMIERYQIGQRSYFWVPSFPRYQGDRTREAASRYPAPPSQRTTSSRPAHDLLTSKSSTDIDVEIDIDVEAEAAAPPPPELRPEPNADPVVAHLFGLLDKAAVIVNGAMQAEAWTDLLDITRDKTLLSETFAEAANSGKNPTPNWCRAVLERCIRDNTRPGKWNGDGRARDEPAGKPYARDGPLRTIIVEDSQGNITEETIG